MLQVYSLTGADFGIDDDILMNKISASKICTSKMMLNNWKFSSNDSDELNGRI